ncbi:hypothetical protein [Leptolyngbya iicbica]|uniref:Uncharacterized protein n=1 Tax=Lyngbya confervoides BDU141951 TaxID=1574623 RepID=A0A8T6QJ06_9CYAN|nr:hypothetical protein [Leptolyngbya sp. LK]
MAHPTRCIPAYCLQVVATLPKWRAEGNNSLASSFTDPLTDRRWGIFRGDCW